VSRSLAGLLVLMACESDRGALQERLERAEQELASERRARAEDQLRIRQLEQQVSGVRLQLPTGADAELSPAPSLVIEIAMSGEMTVAGKPLAEADLDKLFRATFARDKATQVIIKSANGVKHGQIVRVMESAKAAGLIRLAIGTL
jgi:biopolymer transport protein ExbD